MDGGEVELLGIVAGGTVLLGFHVGEQRQLGEKGLQRFILAGKHSELLKVVQALRRLVVIGLHMIGIARLNNQLNHLPWIARHRFGLQLGNRGG